MVEGSSPGVVLARRQQGVCDTQGWVGCEWGLGGLGGRLSGS